MENTFKTLIEYHCSLNLRVCASIAVIDDEQFTRDDAYSRGSIRNLMVHIASTDRRWLAGLRNLPDVGHLNFADYPDHKSLVALFETTSKDLLEYVGGMSISDLEAIPGGIPNPRWQILQHMVNHGTDHRSTVLQKLSEFGAPTFDQDFISWLWKH